MSANADTLQAPQESISLKALDELNLQTAELTALKQQGFVAAEYRGNTTIYKLRFRLCGKQVVRYLGCNPKHADEIREALQVLQRARHFKRQLAKRRKAFRNLMQSTTRNLADRASAAGFHFHGYVLRRSRSKKSLA